MYHTGLTAADESAGCAYDHCVDGRPSGTFAREEEAKTEHHAVYRLGNALTTAGRPIVTRVKRTEPQVTFGTPLSSLGPVSDQ